MHQIKYSTIIGILLLAAFPVFSTGQYLLTTAVGYEKIIGALFITLNSLLVFWIGCLLSETLTDYNMPISTFYFLARVGEAVLLFSMIFSSFSIIDFVSNEILYNSAMLLLGMGSIPMTWLLWKEQLVSSWLAVWGLLGYLLLSVGFVLYFLEITNSLLLLLPGGLWEVSFGILLLIKKKELV